MFTFSIYVSTNQEFIYKFGIYLTNGKETVKYCESKFFSKWEDVFAFAFKFQKKYQSSKEFHNLEHISNIREDLSFFLWGNTNSFETISNANLHNQNVINRYNNRFLYSFEKHKHVINQQSFGCMDYSTRIDNLFAEMYLESILNTEAFTNSSHFLYFMKTNSSEEIYLNDKKYTTNSLDKYFPTLEDKFNLYFRFLRLEYKL